MTVVRRRAKPQSTEPWPSYAEPEPRVTSEGQVSSLPSPVQAMWAEAVGRMQLEQSWTSNEAEGLCVALAILPAAPWRISVLRCSVGLVR